MLFGKLVFRLSHGQVSGQGGQGRTCFKLAHELGAPGAPFWQGVLAGNAGRKNHANPDNLLILQMNHPEHEDTVEYSGRTASFVC